MAKRARSDAEKELKSKEILDMTALMFEKQDFANIKMSEIAKALGISNGILFVYFKTKEMLFLRLLMREYESRLIRMEQRMEQDQKRDKESFHQLILEELVEVIEEHELYIRLCSIRGVILEKNVDLQEVINYKKWLYNRFEQIAKRMEEHYKLYKKEAIQRLFLIEESIFVGCELCGALPKDINNILENYHMTAFFFDKKENAAALLKSYLDMYF
ncbi:TetR/AcrR family transcriptional regulator [Anaerosporobacter faecicola]|uniref:TetR/AcrR family transcriptional regulator n=1 Tax=Anaerosporobacter faecicola TaxID=2718714 RepID=UPI001438D2A2|nr:TetR/AcrR family transcriptional regulator [Anaerosporobacter faecicola]